MASLSSLACILTTTRKSVCLPIGFYRCLYIHLFAEKVASLDNTPEPDSEENIEKCRNVSRLSSNHYKRYHGQAPDLLYKDLHHRKMLYAQFGSASGEDPRLLWPSREKLLDQEEEEKEEGSPLHERLALIEAEKDAAEKAVIERRKMIKTNMAMMPKLIAEYKKKQETTEEAAQLRAAKKAALLEEARDYFGYKVKATDPKFQQMVEEKEERERKESKKRKKEEKLKKISREFSPAKPTESEAS